MKTQSKLIAFFVFYLLLNGISPIFAVENPEVAQVNTIIRERGAHWVARETSVTHLPPEQRRYRAGTIKPSLSQVASQTTSTPAISQSQLVGTPTALDWRSYNGTSYVTPVRDQGDCGSCWAFSTVAALESQLAITQQLNLDLSEQVLLSCDKAAGSCDGGYLELASNYIRSSGVPLESCIPYTASDTTPCSYSCSYPQTTYKITSWEYVNSSRPGSPSANALKNALNLYGPLATTMEVYEDFYHYGGGVYRYVSGSYVGGHGVLIVGYDDSNQCFIVKNSWGTNWGENGFFRIAYSEVGGTTAFGAYALVYHRNVVGYLTVSLTPSGAVSSGAKWQVDSGSLNNSGATVSLTPGAHTVHFNSPLGWAPPADQSITISSGITSRTTGIYTAQFGSLSISITPPEAVSAGAKWNVDGGDWNDTDAVISNLQVAQHTVRFNTLLGWSIPPPMSILVYPNTVTSRTIQYVRVTPGTLSINISPAGAVSAGAQWRVDSGSWQDNGASVQLNPGTHVITFSPVAGWLRPAGQGFYIGTGQSKVFSTTYSPRPGNVQQSSSVQQQSSSAQQEASSQQTSSVQQQTSPAHRQVSEHSKAPPRASFSGVVIEYPSDDEQQDSDELDE